MSGRGGQLKSSFVSVNQCRFCGAIIPSGKGAERHGEVCRVLDNVPPSGKLEPMISIKFPCPVVIIKKFIPSTKPEQEREYKSPELGSRRKSSLRALEFLRRVNSSYELDDNDSSEEKYSEVTGIDLTDDIDLKINSKTRKWKTKKRKQLKVDVDLDMKNKSDSKSKPDTAAASKGEKTSVYGFNSNGKYPCPFKGCRSECHSVFKLKEHFLLHLENNPFTCPYPSCNNRKLRGRCHFKEHMDWHEGKNLNLCQKCGRFLAKPKMKKSLGHKHICKPDFRRREGIPSGFYNESAYSRFLNGVKNSEVDKVEEILRTKQKKTITEIIATDPVFQEVCKEHPGFRELIITNKKLNMFKFANSEKYKCSKCTNVYGKMKQLNDHIRNSHTHRPWRCSKCGKGFLQECFLKSHMKFHKILGNNLHLKMAEDGRWECTKCGFQSNFSESVVRHWKLIHNVQVPHSRMYLTKTEKKKGSNKKSFRRKRKTKKVSESESESNSGLEYEDEESMEKVVVKVEKTDSSQRVVKVECEPALELAMADVDAEDIKIELNTKQEVDIHDSNLDEKEVKPNIAIKYFKP